MIPKETGEGSSETTSGSPQEDRLLITCWVKQMKEAKVGKDNSFVHGLQKHCHLRDTRLKIKMKINVYLGVNDLSKINQNFPCQGRVMSQVTREITEREAQKERQRALGQKHPQGCSWERNYSLGCVELFGG